MKAGALLALVALGLLVFAWVRSGDGGRAAERTVRSEGATLAVTLHPGGLATPESTPEPVPVAEEATASAPSVDPVPSAATAPASPGDELLGCVLFGRVRTADGSPFGGWKPHVSATDAAGVRRQTEVTAEGHYSLAGLACGTWILSYGGTGYRLGKGEVELTEAEPIVRRDLVLERATLLTVRVLTPSGQTFWKAQRAREEAKLRIPHGPTAVATLEAPGLEIEEARDAGQNPVGVGSFWTYGPLVEAAGPDAYGVLELHEDPPLFVSLVANTRVVATQSVGIGTSEVTFVVDLETLLEHLSQVTVRVVADDTGEPLTGELWVDSQSTFFVRDGAWTGTLGSGPHTLTFHALGYARIPFEITLEPGQELDLGERRIPRELTIEGRLLDADGKPVFGRLEIGQRDAAGKLRFQDDWHYESDETGTYRIHGLVPGRYVVRTVGDDQVTFPGRDEPPTEWVSGNIEVSTLGGSVTGLDLHLVQAGILVLKGAGALPPDSLCKILDERGDLLRYSGFYPGFVPRFALPPGPCTFVLCDAEWNEVRRTPLTIVPGVTELELAP